MPKPVDQSSEGNWTVSLKDLVDSEKPNLTVELETADLKSLEIAEGTIQPMTMELSTLDLVEIKPGNTVAEINRIVAGESTSVIVDLGEEPAPPPRLTPMAPTAPLQPSVPQQPMQQQQHHPGAQVAFATIPVMPLQPPSTAMPTPASVATRAATAADDDDDSGGYGLVVVVYLIAAAALGISIYLRFFT